MNLTGERWRARKTADLQDRSALRLLRVHRGSQTVRNDVCATRRTTGVLAAELRPS